MAKNKTVNTLRVRCREIGECALMEGLDMEGKQENRPAHGYAQVATKDTERTKERNCPVKQPSRGKGKIISRCAEITQSSG